MRFLSKINWSQTKIHTSQLQYISTMSTGYITLNHTYLVLQCILVIWLIFHWTTCHHAPSYILGFSFITVHTARPPSIVKDLCALLCPISTNLGRSLIWDWISNSNVVVFLFFKNKWSITQLFWFFVSEIFFFFYPRVLKCKKRRYVIDSSLV